MMRWVDARRVVVKLPRCLAMVVMVVMVGNGGNGNGGHGNGGYDNGCDGNGGCGHGNGNGGNDCNGG